MNKITTLEINIYQKNFKSILKHGVFKYFYEDNYLKYQINKNIKIVAE